jgi:hypothetical protein
LVGNHYTYLLQINNGDIETDTTGNLPWTSKPTQLKAGSQVTFSLWTTPEDTSPVTCEIVSDGRVVSKASATGNFGPDCSARV